MSTDEALARALAELRSKGYFLLRLPPRAKFPPAAGWKTRSQPEDIARGDNVAIRLDGSVAVLITNDDQATAWATGEFSEPNVRSARGGHWYFRAREGQANEADRATAFGRMELHVRDKYALVPPSIHPSGRAYEWGRELLRADSLPAAPDVRDLFHPGGSHHSQLLRMSTAAAHEGRPAGEILAQLTRFRDEHFEDARAHPDSELRSLADSAASKFSRTSPPRAPAPATGELAVYAPLDEFDPENGEVFTTVDELGAPDLGIAWIEGGQLRRTTVAAETRRISKEFEQASKGGSRAAGEARAEHERRLKRLLESLPFSRVRDALWPLPEDPTVLSTKEWESANGSLLEALALYFERRVCASDPDSHLLMALWSVGASARSDHVDFAPRLMIEAPYGWGKSTTAESVQLVVPRSVFGAAITPAAAHRVMNEHHPVLLVDESAIQDNPELQRVLRAGFKRGARIIRAAQNQDRGVVMIDPFGWVILTTQVDTKDDLVNRCYQLMLAPGVPERRVRQRDPEATHLRTALARLRLDILLGAEYPRIGEETEAAQTQPGLEPRSRDKLSALWPFALHYAVQERLAAAAARLEEESGRQLANSDKGLVATAVGSIIANAGGLSKLQGADVELVQIQRAVERLLVDMGEATLVPIGGGEAEYRVDIKRYGPRDFTARILRELGLRLHQVGHRARLDVKQLLAVWPSIASRYTGNSTLDEYADREGVREAPGGGSVMLPTLPSQGGSREGLGSIEGASHADPPAGEESTELGSVRSVAGGTRPPYSTAAGGVLGGSEGPSAPGSALVADWLRAHPGVPRYIRYADGSVSDRVTGAVVWSEGDPPEQRPPGSEVGWPESKPRDPKGRRA